MIFDYGEPVEIWRATRTVDGFNNEIWGPYTLVATLPSCGVAPGPSEELTLDGRQGFTSDVAIYAPFDVDVREGDEFVARGIRYEVEGTPKDWRNPFTGWEAGTVIMGNRVEG